jgi:predicted DNA-binding protein (UPF0251 family)
LTIVKKCLYYGRKIKIMARPKKPRFIQGPPVVNMFIPNMVPPWGRGEAVLTLEGFEAIRLLDFQGLDYETAARMMNVSRQTFGRILAEARAASQPACPAPTTITSNTSSHI